MIDLDFIAQPSLNPVGRQVNVGTINIGEKKTGGFGKVEIKLMPDNQKQRDLLRETELQEVGKLCEIVKLHPEGRSG